MESEKEGDVSSHSASALQVPEGLAHSNIGKAEALAENHESWY